MSLYSRTIYAYFPADFEALSFPREALVLKHVARLREIVRLLKFFGLNPYFEASNLRTFAEVFLEKVSLPKFLKTIACDSLSLISFNVIPAIKHTATYFAACREF